ncbi:MAG: putative dsRNA-binding protein [Actinomycetota bacterium]
MTRSTTWSPTPAPAEAGAATLADLLGLLSPERRRQVVTHRSWARSHVDSYERLEFLGDSVLQVVVTAELLRRHPLASEGDLAWMRQAVVGRDACAEAARALGLPAVMVQAALVEALIGACATDLGMPTTEPAVLAAFGPAIDRAEPGRRDPKTALQEHAARLRREVRYEVVSTEGPPHARVFESRVLVDGQELGRGTGTSKQASEREAAVAALARLAEEAAPC